MLSYIIPVDSSKQTQNDATTDHRQQHHLQLSLVPGRYANGNATTNTTTATSTPISKETSISSFASDGTTATITSSSMTNTSASDRHKTTKIVINGKHQPLKRVSFGSSKGSMVETLIYESPLQDGQPSPICENVTQPFPEDCEQTEAEREKVRVSFFQQSKPQEIDLPPDESNFFAFDTDFMMATTLAENDAAQHICYNRTESTESGWDNPFRPGGDLSKEADEIVELIKGGKPITPTPDGNYPPLPSLDQHDSAATANAVNESHQKRASNTTTTNATPNKGGSANGNVQNEKSGATAAPPGAVEVQRTAVQPGDASQVEHVTIKKKPKCKCCIIQ